MSQMYYERSKRGDTRRSKEEWDKLMARARDMLKEWGVSKAEVARRLGISYTSLNERLRKRG